MAIVMKDIHYTLRLFARQPAFALAAVLSLGIGIGANTALFSVTNALLLSPLPYAHEDRLAFQARPVRTRTQFPDELEIEIAVEIETTRSRRSRHPMFRPFRTTIPACRPRSAPPD